MLPLLFFFFLLHHPCLSLNQEGLHLLQAKSTLYDPTLSLSNWNPKDPTPCNWTGITCSSSSISAIDLSNLDLSGPFPPSLCHVTSLTFLSLSFNYINSTLPSLLPCSSLTHLDLSQNLIVGPLPTSLPSSLTYLDLSANNFSGPIPTSFSTTLPNLKSLSLTGNLLTSPIPPSLSNLTTLLELNLSYNPFSPSPIPPSFSNLSSLHTLWLAGCNLVGPIPPSLGLLSALTNLDLSSNSLTGSIPASLAELRSAVQIELYSNSLSGTIPPGFSNITTLRRIDFSMNRLSGTIPDDIFLPPLLDSLHLYQNNLTGPIPTSVSDSSTLSELRLFSNSLSGPLPRDFGRRSPLNFIDLSDNSLTGAIPDAICDGEVLEELLLLDNDFSGNVPESLGRCRTLTRIRLLNNRLSGEVPVGLWALPHVSLLELTGNFFSGSISPSISAATNLSKLLISHNQFTGGIPKEIGALSNLYDFSAADNKLTGPLPEEVTKLPELGQLDLHDNAIAGELPKGVHYWKKLSQLNLANNRLTGNIPPELGDLPVLNYLDLSGNSLTGEIPFKLQNLKLNQFNVSDNRLSGPLPPLYSSLAYRDSLLGNPELCDDLPGLCPKDGSTGRHASIWVLRSVFALSVLILSVGVSCFCYRYWSIKKAKKRTDRAKWTLTSFHKLGFSEYEILDCLDEDNVIGSGASGKVYKAVLSNGEIVAVKKLWGPTNKNAGEEEEGRVLENDGGFEAEVETLGKIRHKNIVKLWCCCSHKYCKLLVYEYMPNGSLGDLLHSSKSGLLDWPTRYRIALDAAEGLSYLHHDCVPPIVHRDVKSNNILLDGEFQARVADFGVAKVIGNEGQKSMSVIAGSCGYIAPEYAYTLRVNEKSDIYSFGVVILELVTGKLPIDPAFGEKDIVKWVCSTLEQKGMDHVLDPKLGLSYKEAMCKVLNIGLLCASNLPINRPSMRRVVKMLLDVGPEDKSNAEKKTGKLSPYYHDDATSDQGSVV